MTSRFEDKKHDLHVRLLRPTNREAPYVMVEASVGADEQPTALYGKMDTGASRSFFTFAAAHSLGITKPRKAEYPGKAKTATGRSFTYHVHTIHAYVTDENGRTFSILLHAGFSKQIKQNYFGMDWAQWFHVLVDQMGVHLLRDWKEKGLKYLIQI